MRQGRADEGRGDGGKGGGAGEKEERECKEYVIRVQASPYFVYHSIFSVFSLLSCKINPLKS